jgi:hypothetical protein
MKPGEEIIEQGLADLAEGNETIPALLVSIGATRLREAGFAIPFPTFPSPEDRLYAHLNAEDSDDAHSRYNALIRRLVSFARALECGI